MLRRPPARVPAEKAGVEGCLQDEDLASELGD